MAERRKPKYDAKKDTERRPCREWLRIADKQLASKDKEIARLQGILKTASFDLHEKDRAIEALRETAGSATQANLLKEKDKLIKERGDGINSLIEEATKQHTANLEKDARIKELDATCNRYQAAWIKETAALKEDLTLMTAKEKASWDWWQESKKENAALRKELECGFGGCKEKGIICQKHYDQFLSDMAKRKERESADEIIVLKHELAEAIYATGRYADLKEDRTDKEYETLTKERDELMRKVVEKDTVN